MTPAPAAAAAGRTDRPACVLCETTIDDRQDPDAILCGDCYRYSPPAPVGDSDSLPIDTEVDPLACLSVGCSRPADLATPEGPRCRTCADAIAGELARRQGGNA